MLFSDPRDNADFWLEEIWDWAGPRVRDLVRASHDPLVTTVLDVGADQGKYRILLEEFPHVDGCEVWSPSIDENELHKIYNHVFAIDVVDFVHSRAYRSRSYDVVIFGDVLEHIDRYVAQATLTKIYENPRCDVIVVVPFESHQDYAKNNPFQVHLQDDLTLELMEAEYPELNLIDVEYRHDRPFKGIYRRY
jgi:hypothetical protein